MEYNDNGILHPWKPTSIEEYLKGRKPRCKMTTMEKDELVLITFKLKAKQQLMVVALLRATLLNTFKSTVNCT